MEDAADYIDSFGSVENFLRSNGLSARDLADAALEVINFEDYDYPFPSTKQIADIADNLHSTNELILLGILISNYPKALKLIMDNINNYLEF